MSRSNRTQDTKGGLVIFALCNLSCKRHTSTHIATDTHTYLDAMSGLGVIEGGDSLINSQDRGRDCKKYKMYM